MAMFTMAVEIDDAEIALNCLTPQLTTLTTYNLVKNYWKNLGLNAEVSVYTEFDTIPSSSFRDILGNFIFRDIELYFF